MISTLPYTPTIDTLSRIRLEIRALQPQLVAWRRGLHQKPELGFTEYQTAKFISQQLTTWGIEHQTEVANTGIVATIKGHRPGPVLAIRADMDALPIHELNDVPYRSQHEGLMHACGHDTHVAAMIGYARILSEMKEQWKGTFFYRSTCRRNPFRS